MTLIDLILILIILLFSMTTALPGGLLLFTVCALIIERLIVGDRPIFRSPPR